MLLEMDRPAEALAEYEASLRPLPTASTASTAPARAAELSGDKSKARQYYGQLAANCGPGAPRKEVQQARAFLGKTS